MGRPVRTCLAAAAALAAASCGSAGPALHPASGRVLIDNQPAVGATVVFIPAGDDAAAKPSGIVGDDGRFTLSTYPHGDGAPAGEYTVIVTWYPPNAREQANPANKLPAKYADPATSGIKRSVRPGANDLEPVLLTGGTDKPGRPGKR